MKHSDTLAVILSIVSLLIGILALASEQYRTLLISIFTLVLAAYLLADIYRKLSVTSEDVKKLNEKLKIYQELTDMNARIKHLEETVFKK